MSDSPIKTPPLAKKGNGPFSDAERDSLYRVIHSRRDIRHFQSQPIPPEVLARILEAAHAAPSVGFMQPWNFIVIESREIRQQIKASFDAVNAREKEKAAKVGREDLYGSFRLEGILDSPVNVAITCDPSRNEDFILGRDPMPQTADYSVCLAIQNLWLAARVEGIGVGWVSILDQEAVEQILDLPKGIKLVAYLCIGYPVEFRPKPMLEELGWKKRTGLETLIFKDKWGTSPS